MPSVPIILYTLFNSEQLEAAAQKVGIRKVVAKHDGVDVLLQAVEELLAQTTQQPGHITKAAGRGAMRAKATPKRTRRPPA
jgi:DNA-binding NarL/FixJ family response regulator